MEDKVLYYGTVIWFNPSLGYGFISWLNNEGIKQSDIFLHFSDISCDGFKTVYKNQKVSFNLGTNLRGDPKAINITVMKN